MSTVVLTLGGLNYRTTERMGPALRGYASSEGRTHVIVDYPQSYSATSLRKGLIALTSAVYDLVAAQQPFELMGMSQGAEVIGDWLDAMSQSASAPSPVLLRRIILLGNPERALGGVVDAGFPWEHGFLGKRTATRTDSPYRVDDIARVDDPWANSDQWGAARRKSALAMTLARTLGIGSTHTAYEGVDLDACRLRGQAGLTRYWVHN